MNKATSVSVYVFTPLLLLLLGFGSSYLTNSGNSNVWYANLHRAPWTPPGWVFSVVWSVLYILLGFVLARTLVRETYTKLDEKLALAFLIAGIAFVLAWPFVYFMARLQVVALVLLILIVLLLCAYCVVCGLHRRWVEVACTAPLVVWGAFATSLAVYPLLSQPQ